MHLTHRQCAEALMKWYLAKLAVDNVRAMGREVGYSDSSFFGGSKRRTRLMEEVAILHSALGIQCVNGAFDTADATLVIDNFLELARTSVLAALERRNREFKARYTARIGSYFNALAATRENAIGMSFIFMKSLDVDPLKNVEKQVYCAARIHSVVKQTMDVLQRIEIRQATPALDVFKREIQSWPAEQAETALRILKAVMTGAPESEIRKHWGALTVSQVQRVGQLLEAISGDTKR